MVTLHGHEVKLGYKVWTIRDGWVEVNALVENGEYPIETLGGSFTENGKYHRSDAYPSLLWQAYTIPPNAYEKSKQKVKKYLVLYRMSDGRFFTTDSWTEKYFASKEDFLKVDAKDCCQRAFISLILDSETEFDA